MQRRSDEEVADILLDLYRGEYGGKEGQRYLIAWSDVRSLYNFGSFKRSRFESLAEVATEKRLYIFDLGEGAHGHLIAVVKMWTVDRWRKVPKRIIDEYRLPPDDADDGEDDGE
jgi:hypothetical protein